MNIKETIEDLRLEYSPLRLYRFVDDLGNTVFNRKYRKRVWKAVRNDRSPDYDYISRDIQEHLFDCLIHQCKYLLKLDWRVVIETRKEYESILYSIMGLIHILERDYPPVTIRTKEGLEQFRKSVEMEEKHKEECSKELYKLLEKYMHILGL